MENKQEAIYYNKKVYNGELGDDWDSKAFVKDYRNKIMTDELKKMLSNLKGDKLNLIDLGCGTGAMALNFYKLDKNAKVHCIDISENMINRLRKKLSKEDLKRSKLVVSDVLEYLKSTNVEFDIIGVSGAMHHFYDYLDVLDMSCKRLKEGGFIYWDVEPKKVDNFFKIYIAKIIRTFDCACYQSKSPIRFILYILISFSNFIPLIDKNKVRNLEYKIINLPVDSDKKEEFLKSETYEGLDLDEIKKVLNKNNIQILKIGGGTASNFVFFHNLLNFFDVNGHFSLIAFN